MAVRCSAKFIAMAATQVRCRHRRQILPRAIQDRASQGSEANAVIFLFHQLSEQQKQDLLNFLRSL